MTKPWLAQFATFKEAFPSVVSMDVQYWITGDGTKDIEFPLPLGRNCDPVIECVNPRCKNGGAKLAPLITKMVTNNVAEQTHDVGCSNSGCYNRFKIDIKLVIRSLPDTEKA